MRNGRMVLAVLGAVALLAVGIAVASNMAFLLNYELTGPEPGPVTGTNTIALPFHPPAALLTASDLAAAIEAASPGSVVSIQRYNKATSGIDSYTLSGSDLTGFALTVGEGYRVTVSKDVNYIIVGSHDPSLSITLTGPGDPPVVGTNTYAYPYHSIASNASELAFEINAAGTGSVVSIQRYNKPANGLDTYTTAGTDLIGFDLQAGRSYRITVSGPVSFVPAHY